MENHKIMLYALAGAWDTAYHDGTGVIGISEDVDILKAKLKEIADSKAKEYLENPYGDTEEEIGERHYELTDAAGGYAKFSISEHYVEISDALMEALYRVQDKKYRIEDVKQAIEYECQSGCLESDMYAKYEYAKGNPEVIEAIVERFEKTESCEVSFNATMNEAITAIVKGIDIGEAGMNACGRNEV